MPEEVGDPLAGVRVIDTADATGAYCGRLLADLGADVLLVEPLDGLDSRRHEPFVEGEGGEVISCFDRFVNLNKRSITLALGSAEAAATFRALVSDADVLIETPEAGLTGRHGLSEEDLAEANPRLVRVLVSAFGDGPYSGRSGDDLVTLATGGLLSLGGYREGPPIAVHGEQTYLARSIFAAAGTIAALVAREVTGEGQVVEVCAQEAIANALEDALPDFDLNGRVRRRFGEVPREAGTGTFRCADGHVALVAGRLGTQKAFRALIEWMSESGAAAVDEELAKRFEDHAFRASEAGIAAFTERFEAFASTMTKADLYREGQRRRIAIAPVNTHREVLEDRQLAERDFFQRVEDQSGATFCYPGRPYSIDGIGPFLRRPPPGVGEHSAEVLAALDRSSQPVGGTP